MTGADSYNADLGAMATPREQAPLQVSTAAASVRSQLLGRRATVESVVQISKETSPRLPQPRRSCLSTAGGACPSIAASGVQESSGVQVSPSSATVSGGATSAGAGAIARRPMSAGSGAVQQRSQQPRVAAAGAPAPVRVLQPPTHPHTHQQQQHQHQQQNQHQQPRPAKQASLKQVLGAIGVVPASSRSRGSSFTRREDGAGGDAQQQGPSSTGHQPASARPAAAAPAGLNAGGSSSSCKSVRAWSHGVEHTLGRTAGSPLFRSSRPMLSCRHMATYEQEQEHGGGSAAAASAAGAAGAVCVAAATTGGDDFASPGDAGVSGQRRRSRRLSCSAGIDQVMLAASGHAPASAVGSPAVQGSLPSASCSGVLGGAAGPRHILGSGSYSHSRRRASVSTLPPALAVISDFLSAQHSAVASATNVAAATAGGGGAGGARRASSRNGRLISASGAAGSNSLVAVAAAVTAATHSLCHVQRLSAALDRPASAATAFAAAGSPVPSSATAANARRLFSTASVPASAFLRAGGSAHSSVLGATAAASELHGAGGSSARASSGVRATVVAAQANASGSSYPSTNSSFVFAADGSRPAALSRAALASASATGLPHPSALGHDHAPRQYQNQQQGPEANWCHNPTFNTTGGSRARGRSSGFRYADAGAAAASGGRERCVDAGAAVVSPGADQTSAQRAPLRPPTHGTHVLPMPLPSSSAMQDSLSAASTSSSDTGFANPAEPPAAARAAGMGLFAEAAGSGLGAEAGVGDGTGAGNGNGRFSRPSRKTSRTPALEAITSGVAASAAVADDVVCELGHAGAGTTKQSPRSTGFWVSLKRALASAVSCARPTTTSS